MIEVALFGYVFPTGGAPQPRKHFLSLKFRFVLYTIIVGTIGHAIVRLGQPTLSVNGGVWVRC